MRVLFVSNGHGETSIADRIAAELRSIVPQVTLEHLALVGDFAVVSMDDVGPRRAMPSGGLIAMGNVGNIARDVGAGLIALTYRQWRFLRSSRGRYDACVAVGDAFALAMAFAVRVPTIFVGTAKSVNVAPYGPFERKLMAKAAAVYVRDRATADRLRAGGVDAESANVIVDLFNVPDDPRADEAVAGFTAPIALFPGSRDEAYADAAFLLQVAGALARDDRNVGAVLSIAPTLDAERIESAARAGGWECKRGDDEKIPFALVADGRIVVRAWRGPIGPLLRRVTLVLGQAGTANEAAAAAGVGVVAFEGDRDRKSRWYRRRQLGLLGDALAIAPQNVEGAVATVAALLVDEPRRAHMAAVGRQRMGEAGSARTVARRIAEIASNG